MSAESSAPSTSSTATSSPEFGGTAMAIFVTMVLLIVALTGILVETTWRNPSASVEALSPDPGSFAGR